MLEKVKTGALILAFAGNFVQIWLNKSPCEAIQMAMDTVGVDTLAFDAVEGVETGPPLTSKLILTSL